MDNLANFLRNQKLTLINDYSHLFGDLFSYFKLSIINKMVGYLKFFNSTSIP